MGIKKLIALSLSIMIYVSVKAQDPLYSQYTMNKFLINPAVAGTSGFTNVCLTAREQWMGFKGTPKTHSLSFDSKIFPDSYISKTVQIKKKKKKSSKSGKVGVGGHIYNDHTETLNRTGFIAAYAYHIDLDNALISMGLALNFFQFRLNSDKVVLSDDVHDDLIDGGKQKIFVPDANVGIYAVSEKYYGGLSAINVLRSSIQFGDKSKGDFKQNRQYNIMGGCKYVFNENLVGEPSFLLKVPQGGKAQLDLQAKMNFKKDYWAGLAFRTGSAFSVFGGIKVDRYIFGYAYDYNFNSMMKYSFGSHEFMAAVKFGDNARRYKWLNSF